MSLSRPHALLCGLVLVACAAPESAPETNEKSAQTPAPVVTPPTIAEKPEPAPQSPPDASPPPSEPAQPIADPDAPIGVAACDAYADRYRSCIADKLQPGDRDRHTRVLHAQLTSWLAAKADPKLAAALEGECTAAAEAARATTRVFGCVWRDGDAPEPEKPKAGKLKPEVVEMPRGIRPPGLDPLGELD